MTSAIPGARHLHLVEYPSDRLTPLRQEYVGLTSENGELVAHVAPEPKFLGCCCGPAKSCCCGCSLQFAVKAFALYHLVPGVLGLMDFVLCFSSDSRSCFGSLIYGGLLLALGICLWRTASEPSPKCGESSLYFLAGVCIMYVIGAILLTAIPFPVIQSEHSHSRDSTLGKHDSFIWSVSFEGEQALLISNAVFNGFLYLIMLYYTWSFIVRAKRGESLLLTLGPNNLPTFVLQPVPQQFGVYYPPQNCPTQSYQLQPTASLQPLYYYPVQGSQVQQSVMHPDSTSVPHPVASQPNSQTQLIRQQPTAAQLPQRPVQGSQVQQPAMQAAPHFQPPPPPPVYPVQGSQLQQSVMQAEPHSEPPPQ